MPPNRPTPLRLPIARCRALASALVGGRDVWGIAGVLHALAAPRSHVHRAPPPQHTTTTQRVCKRAGGLVCHVRRTVRLVRCFMPCFNSWLDVQYEQDVDSTTAVPAGRSSARTTSSSHPSPSPPLPSRCCCCTRPTRRSGAGERGGWGRGRRAGGGRQCARACSRCCGCARRWEARTQLGTLYIVSRSLQRLVSCVCVLASALCTCVPNSRAAVASLAPRINTQPAHTC